MPRWQIIVAVVVVVTLVLVVILVPTLLLVTSVEPGITSSPSDPIIFRAYGEDLKYADTLDNLFEKYEFMDVDQGQLLMDCGLHERPADSHPDAVCIFKMNWLGIQCSREERWGYERGQPCVILTPNKVEDWVPEPYQSLEELPEDMPQSLKDHITHHTQLSQEMPRMAWVSCEGAYPADIEYIGEIEMSPWHGFPVSYFPYKPVPYYMQPLIGLVFQRLQSHELVNVVCRLWSKNIDPNENPLRFQILMD